MNTAKQLKNGKKIAFAVFCILIVYSVYQLYDKVLKYELFIDYNYEETYNYTDEFMRHVEGFDKVMFNGDPLMPDLIYFRQNKIVGIATSRGPEWGIWEVRYFFDDNQRLTKVINHNDGKEVGYMISGKEVVPDLLVVVDVINKKAFAYGRTQNGDEVDSSKWLEKFGSFHLPDDLKQQHWKIINSCEVVTNEPCYQKDAFVW